MQGTYSNLADLLADIVVQYPERTAISDSRQSLTYLELYQYASGVAANCTRHGINAGDRVVCISKKDTGSLICFWGILLCGGIPVMLDHEDGIQTNETKIKEVAASAIIMDKKALTLSPAFRSVTVLDMEEVIPTLAACPAFRKPDTVSFPAVCYILLTSGTTGNQKAVQITHANVLHYTFSMYAKLGCPEKVHAAHASTFAADLGLTNLLVALVSGGMLRILSKVESTDPALFTGIINREQISLLKITPSHLTSLVPDNENPFIIPVRDIVLGGEKLSWELVKNIFSLGICSNLYNHYGPTEATVGAIAFKIEPSYPYFGKTGSVPLGMPLGEGACFINDETDGQGELYLAGPGVSIGYLNNEAENNKKFFIKEGHGKKTCCYRTGDICKKLDDGNYEFLYRTDRQVKVKGYRIELGEIELAIAAHPDVEQVIAAVSEFQGHTILDAYIKPLAAARLTATSIRNWLLNRCPGYKIPSNFYFYIKAPYNANGKIDFNALKHSFTPSDKPVLPEVVPPDQSTWPALAEATWKKILNRSHIQHTDHFFEIGGDSLLAIRLIGTLQRHNYKISITDLNNNPVFKDFVQLEPADIVASAEKNEKQLYQDKFTYSQYQFLYQEKFDHNRYCQALLLETSANIQLREMAFAINCVLRAHAQLTTAFRRKNGYYASEIKNIHHSELGTSVLDNNLSVAVQIQEMTVDLLDEVCIDEGKLFVAHVFIDPQGKDYLYLACHHLVVDVISWNIIMDELLDYYEQACRNIVPVVVPENAVNDFVNQLALKKNPIANNQDAAVQKLYRLPAPIIVADDSAVTAVLHLQIPPNISGLIKRIEEQQEITISGLLSCALGNAICTIAGISKISMDVEFYGRPRDITLPDVSRSVAWWATTLPVTLQQQILSPVHCSDLIEKKAHIANSNYIHTHLYAAPAGVQADILFNYLGRFPAQFGNAAIKFQPSSFNPGATRHAHALGIYPLIFTGRFIGDSLIIDIQYQANRLAGINVKSMVSHFYDYICHYFKVENPTVEAVPLTALQSNVSSAGQPLYNPGIKKKSPPTDKKILLTGATGFLGSHVLCELLQNSHTQLYCIVRGDSHLQAVHRLNSTLQYYFGDLPEALRHRIKVIRGDLAKEHLGMAATDYHQMAHEVNLVIHAAADTNLMKTYADLTPANITSVKNLLQLAQTGKHKEIHYISTLAVSGYTTQGSARNFSESDFDYGQFFLSDYERSKFEAEKIVRLFVEQGGQGVIYRTGHIAADSIEGRFQRNMEQNRVIQLMKGFMLLKAIPDGLLEKVAFSYVDIVARAIANSCLQASNEAMTCYHLENPQAVSFAEMGSMLQHMGYEIESVEMDAFMEKVYGFEGIQSDKKIIDFMTGWVQRSINFPRRVNYIQRNSLDALAQGGLYFPKLTQGWFTRMIAEGIKAGCFYDPLAFKPANSLIVEKVIV